MEPQILEVPVYTNNLLHHRTYSLKISRVYSKMINLGQSQQFFFLIDQRYLYFHTKAMFLRIVFVS